MGAITSQLNPRDRLAWDDQARVWAMLCRAPIESVNAASTRLYPKTVGPQAAAQEVMPDTIAVNLQGVHESGSTPFRSETPK